MKIETKFSCGDTCHLIRHLREERWEPCGFCEAKGRIAGKDGAERPCPECYGRLGKKTYHDTKWTLDRQLTVGEVQYRFRAHFVDVDESAHDAMYDNYGSQEEERRESYMCRETGIGTGSCWPAQDLFPTSEEAQAECERRNAEAE